MQEQATRRARGVDAIRHVVLDVGSDGAALRAVADTRCAELIVPCADVVALELPPTVTVAGAIFDARTKRVEWFAASHVLRHRWPAIPLLLCGPGASSSAARTAVRELGIERVMAEPEAARDALIDFIVRAHTRRLQQCQRMDIQFDEWRLTPSERELAALIAFGLKRPAWNPAMGSALMVYQWTRHLRSATRVRRTADLIPKLKALFERTA